MAVKKGFRTSEVAKLTGLTLRQLDHWDRTGLFRPSLAQAEGRGSARFYSFGCSAAEGSKASPTPIRTVG